YFRGMKVEEVACLQGNPWRRLSDHLPLYARFKLE
ncbi:MAG: EEP domain-containing protein, partial [Legionellales bacterium]